MDGSILPLTFYCRNAQLCLAKATESQNSGFGAEELQHLRTFTTLVSETIPSHPNYRNRQEEKQVLELHAYLPEAGKRIREVEVTGVDSSRTRRQLTTHERHGSRHSKPPVDVAVASRARAKTAAGGPRHCDSSSPESMTKPQKSVRIAGISRSPKQTLAEKDQKWDINLSLNMQETYGTVLTKCMTLPRPISLVHRQKDAKPPVHHLQAGKEVTRSQVLLHSAAGEPMPCLPKSRDTLRMRGRRGTLAVSSSDRSRKAERNVSSRGKNAEMPSYEFGHESPSNEKSSFTHESSEIVGKDLGGRVEYTENNQEVVLVKSCTHLISKHKLGKQATSERVRTKASEVREAPLEHRSSGNVDIVGTNQDEDGMGNEDSRGFRSGNASDGMKQSHHRRKKQYEDHERHGSRGDMLREWKGDFVRKSKRIQGGFDEVETMRGSPVRALQSRPRHIVEGRVGNRPASAPRRMQGVVMEHKPKEAGENLDEVHVNEKGSRVFLTASGKHDKPSGLAPELQRGMKEDCEHFRREMWLLKEKANISRIREVDVEGLAEKSLQRRLVDEMDLAGGDPNRLKHNINRALRDSSDIDKVCAMHGNIIDSPRMNRLRGGHPPVHQGPDPPKVQEIFESGGVHLSQTISPSVTTGGSTSGSSLTSLPLSHYIQKLKDFSPDSQLGSANLELLNPVNKSAGDDSNQRDHREKYTGVLPTSNEWGNGLSLLSAETSLSSGGSAPAILLPASTNSSNSAHGLLPHHSRLVNNKLRPVRTSALYTSIAHPTKFRASQLDSGSVALFNSNPDIHHQDEKRAPATITTLNDQLLYPHLQNDIENNTLLGGNDDKMNIQRLLGELKGSVAGMEIRLEVDGQGWRGRVDGLEKELENLKEEVDDEIIAAKHSLRNEMKVKLGDLMAEMEKMRRHERVEIEMMVEERIEKAQKDTRSSVDMKDEIHHLWAEVETLVKSREEMHGHVQHLTSIAQKAQEHANREHDMLKSENGYLRKQLQFLKNDVQVRLETDDFRAERENLRLAVDRLRGEGTDMNLEIQSLKKVEKLIKLELENIRSGLAKLQEETQDLVRQKGKSQIEGGRERLLIMEKVETLSQLYLGGLEEVRADVFNVKFNCQDRIQDFENQLKEFRNQLPEESTFASKQMLLNELDHFRGEIAETVEIERGLLRQTLERESEAVQHRVKELLVDSKGEIVNVVKLDVQKWLQATHEKIFLMTQAMKQDLNILKNELSRTQEGAEDLIQIISAAEIQRNVAAAAAVEASMSATEASSVLLDVTTNINSEMSTVHHRIKQFHENLTVENDVVVSATYEARKVSQELLREKEAALLVVQEARQKHQELQNYLETESSRLSIALIEVQKDGVRVQKERDTASQAASEATSSAMKAGEVLAEILGIYKLEVARARNMSLQLQEGLEKDKAVLERERELASHNAQERFNEDLELAIDGLKRAMNAEIAKAKEATDELEKQARRRTPFDPDYPNFQLATTGFAGQPDLKNYISKTEASISGLAAMVKELQDCKERLCEEKKRHMILKQQESERKEQHWNGEISQINQVVRVVEKRMLDVCGDYTEMRKRLKKCEGAQLDLVHTVEVVSSTTGDLAKAVSNWLPKYEAAARVVNDLSCKVERVEEKLEGFSCDEGLVQRISRVAETKVEGLKELVFSSGAMKDIGQELRDLHERVESSDRDHSQAIGEVATRVAVLERTRGPAGQPSPGLSLKVEYTDSAEARKQGMGSLSQSVEALERKMEFMTEHTGALVGGHESATDSRLLGLESRIEHVASATFTNLRLLDSKVDRVSLGMQSAVEGAALAESKCGALGAELVKVFRMLTACKNPINSGNSTNRQQTNINNDRRGRSHSPPTQSLNPQLDSRSQSPHNRATTFPRGKINRAIFSPKRRSRIHISPNRPKGGVGPEKRASHRSMARNGEADSLKVSTGSDSGKLTARDQAEGESTCSGASEEASSPNKTRSYYLRTSLHDPVIGCKLQTQGAQLAVHERPQSVERPQLNPHSPLERRLDSPGKSSRPNSAIRLEAGRIHVNVTHRSAVVSQSEKRENMIAVQT